jgi:hypothetical protein
MENISRGPTFGDFVTILREGSMKDVTVSRSWVILRPSPCKKNFTVMVVCTVVFRSKTVIPTDKSKRVFGTDSDRNRVTWETPNSEAIPSVKSQ